MCVHIVKGNRKIKYDTQRPLVEQLKDSKEVIVNYLENDHEVHHFLDQIEKYSISAFAQGLKIRVLHNDMIKGIHAKHKADMAMCSMELNDLIRLMAISHYEIDSRLEEIANLCLNKDYNE